MYITNKTKKYPCTGYWPRPDVVMFSGVEGVTLPISGEIRLISEDNDLILAIQDCRDYARQIYEGGVLTLTNDIIKQPLLSVKIGRAGELDFTKLAVVSA